MAEATAKLEDGRAESAESSKQCGGRDALGRPAVRNISWPLVGRTTEFEQVQEMLAAGRGAVVIAGPAGVGKTRFGQECLELAAARGFATVRVAATQGTADLPFGAFARLVPQLDPGGDLLELLRKIGTAIVDQGGGKPVALLVDDVHLLDPSSAALVNLLAVSDRVFLLATLRSQVRVHEQVVALWKDGAAVRLELGFLGADEVRNLLESTLHGPVDGACAREFHARSEGNALFVRELVLAALDHRVLRRTAGVWRLRGCLPASARLIEIVQSRLGELDAAVRRHLAILALGDPLEVALLTEAAESIDLSELENRGMLRIEEVSGRLVARFSHPIYGEVVRSTSSPLVTRASAARLAKALQQTGARRREDALRLAVWSLEGGIHTEPGPMFAGAVAARQRHDFPLAERLGRQALREGAGFDAHLLVAQACWLQGKGIEALAILGSAQPAGDRQRTDLAMARITVLDWTLKRTDDAIRVAEVAETQIEAAEHRDQVTAERARILGRSGRHAEAIAVVSPLLERVSGGALVSSSLAAATSMAITGQFSAAIEASRSGYDAHLCLEGNPLAFGPYLHLAIRSKALENAGRLAEAWSTALSVYDRAVADGSPQAQAFAAYAMASVAILEGRVATAARIAGEAAGIFRELRWPLWIRNALSHRARALAHLGRASEARATIDEALDLEVPEAELFGPDAVCARAWVEVAEEDPAAGLASVWQAAKIAARSGAFALEAAALHDAARLGRPSEVSARLAELTGVVEGVLAQTRARHAGALAKSDAAELGKVCDAFAECGARLLAAEAAADCAAAWHKTGQARKGTGWERRCRMLLEETEGARTPAVTVLPQARAALTPRELEIAGLVAQGLSNKEVADRLFLSHRTIENRLHAVYEKLGLRSRSELAKAVAQVEWPPL